MIDVTEEDRFKAELYFAEQLQQQQLQQQLYYNGGIAQTAPVVTTSQFGGNNSGAVPQILAANTVSFNQLDAPYWNQQTSASPRLKPIVLADGKFLTSGGSNTSSSSNANKKTTINTKQQTFPARFRN